MRRESTVWSALLTLLLAHTSLAQETKPMLPLTAKLLREIRMVQDAVSLHLEDELPSQTWVVAQTRPDAHSFRAKAEGGYMDDEGKFIVRPDEQARTVVTELGSIKVLATLTGSPAPLTSYEWAYEWRPRPLPKYSQEEVFPLFRSGSGGTAILRINAEEKGRDLFYPAHLLSDEWVPFVQPALKYVQTHKEVFNPALVGQQRERLQQLTLNPNPLLAIAAARALGEAHELDTAFVQGALAQAKGLKQSVFVYLLIHELPSSKHVDLSNRPVLASDIDAAIKKTLVGEIPVEDLGKYIDNAKDADALEDVTNGLVALIDQLDLTPFTQFRVEGLLKHVLMRQKEIGTHTEADAYLDALPVLETIRKDLATQ